MAIMIKVNKRGTNIKKNIRDGIKIATKRLRVCLGISLLLNIIMAYFLLK